MDDTGHARERFAREARGEPPDLGLLCLLVAAEADPSLDEPRFVGCLRELDRLATLVTPPADPGDPADWAAALATALGDREGLSGRPADYRRLDSSLLHRVLERGRGLPILLSVVWIEVGRRV